MNGIGGDGLNMSVEATFKMEPRNQGEGDPKYSALSLQKGPSLYLPAALVPSHLREVSGVRRPSVNIILPHDLFKRTNSARIEQIIQGLK
jgi:hypothetical protein